MKAIQINDGLSIVTGDSEGVIINCFAGSDTGVMDIFNVSLFFSSVKSMLESLESGEPWENTDKSLAVSGGGEGVTLTFRMQGPPFGDVDVVLDGDDSKKFMEGMSKIAGGN